MGWWSILGWKLINTTLQNVNNSTDHLLKFSGKSTKTLDYVTKVTGVSTGAAGAAKETVDVLEAVACTDDVCAVVSGVGVCADCLSMAA